MRFSGRDHQGAEGGLHLAAPTAAECGVKDHAIGSVEGVGRRSGNTAAPGQGPWALGKAAGDRNPGGNVAAAVAAEAIRDCEDEANARAGRRLTDDVLCRRCYVGWLAVQGNPAKPVLVVLPDMTDYGQTGVFNDERFAHGFLMVSGVGAGVAAFISTSRCLRPRRGENPARARSQS